MKFAGKSGKTFLTLMFYLNQMKSLQKNFKAMTMAEKERCFICAE